MRKQNDERTTLRITSTRGVSAPRCHRRVVTTGSLVEHPQHAPPHTLRSILKSNGPAPDFENAPSEFRGETSEGDCRPVMLLWSFSQRGSQDLHGVSPLKHLNDRHRQVTFQQDERLRSVREFPSPRVASAPATLSSSCGFESNLSSTTTAAPCSGESSVVTCDSWEAPPFAWRDRTRFVSLKSSSTNSNTSSHSERLRGYVRRLFSRAKESTSGICIPAATNLTDESSGSDNYLDITDDGSSSSECEPSVI